MTSFILIVLTACAASALCWLRSHALELLLWRSGAVEAAPEQAPGVHAIIRSIRASVNGPPPRLFVTAGVQPNGFALARGERRVIVLTESAFSALNDVEMQGLLALLVAACTAHSASRDTLTAAFASVWPTPAAKALIRRRLPWSRWLAIDSRAAQLVNAAVVARALRMLNSAGRNPDVDILAALRPLAVVSSRRSGSRTFPTHPSVESRLAALGESVPKGLSLSSASGWRPVKP